MSAKPFALAVKALVADKQGRLLAIRRSAASSQFGGNWDLPGGKVDPGESFDVALVREVAEETGLNYRSDRRGWGNRVRLPEGPAGGSLHGGRAYNPARCNSAANMTIMPGWNGANCQRWGLPASCASLFVTTVANDPLPERHANVP